ncbi:hypothetical protein DL93DRAFT_1249501 [Clavulina sp. PMI_390]|nr:hypothetical protein DL93DRAFT_1249501 [Clavulina sp. PMI_390]
MSSNRKLTEWFGKSSSSSQGSSSSKSTPPSQNAKPRSETSRVATATKGGSTRPSSSHNSVSSNPSSSASKPKSATRPVTIDIDSSIEMVSAPAPRKQASQKSSSTRTAGSSSSSSKESRTALTKLKTSSALPLQAKQQPASPVVIDLSSSPDTPSSKSIITISDDSSDMISLPLKRSNSNTSAMSEAKRRRTSNNSSSSSSPLVRPVMAQATSSDEDEEKHVEINLTMPDMEDIGQDDGGPSSAVDANANAMDWVPTPPSHIEPSPFSSFKPLDASPRSAQSGSDVEMSEQEASVGRNPPKNLPRRSRLASTPPTSVSPQGPVTASESSKDIIARMTQNLRSASETSSDDDDLKAAKALAAESSDSDGDSDDELLLVPSKYSSSAAKKPAASSRSTRPGLFSSSSLSSVPDGEDTPMSEAGDSSPEPIARRRSSRKVNPPKPTVPLTPTLTKPRGGKSVFDKLLTEHTRRQKNRGGVDGYQRAQEALESSESEDEQQSNVNGSVAGQSHRSGHSRSRHSRHSSILPDSADETTSDDANGEDDEFAGADKLAQELLGEENAKAIRHLTETAGARKGSKHLKRGDGELKMVRASRRLWEKALNPVDQPPLEPRLEDSLVSRIYNATRSEKALEATMHLQRCGRSDPSVRRQLVSALLPAAICATDVLLADSATLKLVRMIRSSPDDLESMGLRLQDIIASACSALGARPDIIKTLFLAQNDPLGFGQAAQQYSIMARGKAHRALCVSRYMQLLEAIGS